jgi:zinc finger-containing ubiquitin peptidase 1
MQQPDARYGCGYRNIQVMMSFLVRRGQDYAQRVYGGRGIPTVHALQRSIELSWSQGFDVDGAAQLVLPSPCPCPQFFIV